jgi:uncharacterized protein YbjT (DUF2867 family)
MSHDRALPRLGGMKIAIVGATGMVGAPISEILGRRGHEVRPMSRSCASCRVDVTSGDGLARALDGVDAVINATNGPASGKAARVLVDGTKRLLEATSAHHVCVSIVGIGELAPFSSYYRVKVAQEEAVRESGRPFTIVRATQLHDFVGGPLRRVAKAGLQLCSRALLQPVDGSEVAAVIASVAEGAPRQGTVTVAGPEILTITEMRLRGGFPVPLPMPPGLGRSLRAGAATVADPDVRGRIAYREWLTKN